MLHEKALLTKYGPKFDAKKESAWSTNFIIVNKQLIEGQNFTLVQNQLAIRFMCFLFVHMFFFSVSSTMWST